MSDDLISRQELIGEMCKDCGSTKAPCLAPCPDVIIAGRMPLGRKKGKWIASNDSSVVGYCSECHKKFAQTHWAIWEDGSLPRSFCPNCGAKMEGKDGDENG